MVKSENKTTKTFKKKGRMVIPCKKHGVVCKKHFVPLVNITDQIPLNDVNASKIQEYLNKLVDVATFKFKSAKLTKKGDITINLSINQATQKQNSTKQSVLEVLEIALKAHLDQKKELLQRIKEGKLFNEGKAVEDSSASVKKRSRKDSRTGGDNRENGNKSANQNSSQNNDLIHSTDKSPNKKKQKK